MDQLTTGVLALAEQPPAVLYHYTTHAGALGILSERAIRATATTNLNDFLEGAQFRRLASEEIARRRSSMTQVPGAAWFPNGNVHSQGRLGVVYDLLARHFSKAERPEAVLSSDPQKWPPLTCVASFTTKGDLLSQWRAYSSKEGGVCIGVDPEKVFATTTPKTERVRPQRAVWMRCRYDESEQRVLINDSIDALVRYVSGSSSLAHDTLWYAGPEFALLSAICKNESFADEDEWRLVVHNPGKIHFRTGLGGIVPYTNVALDFESEMVQSCIVSLRVGPGPNQVLAAQGLQQCALRARKPAVGLEPLYSEASWRTI